MSITAQRRPPLIRPRNDVENHTFYLKRKVPIHRNINIYIYNHTSYIHTLYICTLLHTGAIVSSCQCKPEKHCGLSPPSDCMLTSREHRCFGGCSQLSTDLRVCCTRSSPHSCDFPVGLKMHPKILKLLPKEILCLPLFLSPSFCPLCSHRHVHSTATSSQVSVRIPIILPFFLMSLSSYASNAALNGCLPTRRCIMGDFRPVFLRDGPHSFLLPASFYIPQDGFCQLEQSREPELTFKVVRSPALPCVPLTQKSCCNPPQSIHGGLVLPKCSRYASALPRQRPF